MLITALHEVVEAVTALAEAAETGAEAAEAAEAAEIAQAVEGAELYAHRLETLEAAADSELTGRLRPDNLILRGEVEPMGRLFTVAEMGDALDVEDALDAGDMVDEADSLNETEEALRLITQEKKIPRMRFSISSMCSGLEYLRAQSLQSAAGWKYLDALGAESAARADLLREEAAVLLDEAKELEQNGKLFGLLEYPEWGIKEVQEAQRRRG